MAISSNDKDKVKSAQRESSKNFIGEIVHVKYSEQLVREADQTAESGSRPLARMALGIGCVGPGQFCLAQQRKILSEIRQQILHCSSGVRSAVGAERVQQSGGDGSVPLP